MSVSIDFVGDWRPMVYRERSALQCTHKYVYTYVRIWTSLKDNIGTCDKTETAISLIKAIVDKSSYLCVLLFYYEVGRCGNCVGENTARKKVCDVKLRNKRKKRKFGPQYNWTNWNADKRLLCTRTEKWSGREEGIQQ